MPSAFVSVGLDSFHCQDSPECILLPSHYLSLYSGDFPRPPLLKTISMSPSHSCLSFEHHWLPFFWTIFSEILTKQS
jgi:hypothetical protein